MRRSKRAKDDRSLAELEARSSAARVTLRAGEELGRVQWSHDAELQLFRVAHAPKGSRAHDAGLARGDYLISVGAQPCSTLDSVDMLKACLESAPRPLELVFRVRPDAASASDAAASPAPATGEEAVSDAREAAVVPGPAPVGEGEDGAPAAPAPSAAELAEVDAPGMLGVRTRHRRAAAVAASARLLGVASGARWKPDDAVTLVGTSLGSAAKGSGGAPAAKPLLALDFIPQPPPAHLPPLTMATLHLAATHAADSASAPILRPVRSQRSSSRGKAKGAAATKEGEAASSSKPVSAEANVFDLTLSDSENEAQDSRGGAPTPTEEADLADEQDDARPASTATTNGGGSAQGEGGGADADALAAPSAPEGDQQPVLSPASSVVAASDASSAEAVAAAGNGAAASSAEDGPSSASGADATAPAQPATASAGTDATATGASALPPPAPMPMLRSASSTSAGTSSTDPSKRAWRRGEIVVTPFGVGSVLRHDAEELFVALHVAPEVVAPARSANITGVCVLRRDVDKVRDAAKEPAAEYRPKSAASRPNRVSFFTLSRAETARLWPGIYLNDGLIDSFMARMVDEVVAPAPVLRDRVHVFSSHFFTHIQDCMARGKDDVDFGSLARWTRHVDVFAKDFLLFPINDSVHWSLALLCFPGRLLLPRQAQPAFADGEADESAVIIKMDSTRGHRTADISRMLRMWMAYLLSQRAAAAPPADPSGASAPPLAESPAPEASDRAVGAGDGAGDGDGAGAAAEGAAAAQTVEEAAPDAAQAGAPAPAPAPPEAAATEADAAAPIESGAQPHAQGAARDARPRRAAAVRATAVLSESLALERALAESAAQAETRQMLVAGPAQPPRGSVGGDNGPEKGGALEEPVASGGGAGAGAGAGAEEAVADAGGGGGAGEGAGIAGSRPRRRAAMPGAAAAAAAAAADAGDAASSKPSSSTAAAAGGKAKRARQGAAEQDDPCKVDAARLPVVTPPLPMQENGYDCGVYVLMYAERFLLRVAPGFTGTRKQRGDEYLKSAFGADWFSAADVLKKRLELMELVAGPLAAPRSET